MTLQSKVVFLSSLVGVYWNTLLWVIVLLCKREILANKYPCDYSLLQKALVLFSKLFFVVHYSYIPLNSSILRYSEVSKLGSSDPHRGQYVQVRYGYGQHVEAAH